MNLFLPLPYPDELLFSVIARRNAWLGRGWCEDLRHAFGKTPIAVDLPGDLSTLKNSAGPAFEAGRTLDGMTLFPFYTSFLSEERKSRIRAAILGGSGSGRVSLGLQGRGTRGLRPPAFVRVCPRCREHDIHNFGEGYWHRVHQLGGIILCPTHEVELLTTRQKLARRMSVIMSDPMDVPAASTLVLSSLSGIESRFALEVGRRCAGFLRGIHIGWASPPVAPGLYRREAIKRGFGLSWMGVDMPALESAFTEKFGPVLLALWQAKPPLTLEGSWLREAFRDAPFSMSPLEHALVQVFLEDLPVVARSGAPFGAGPWKCPNVLIEHSRPIERVRMKVVAGRPAATADCECGYRFTFDRLDKDGMTPVVLRHVRLPQSIHDEVRRCVDAGSTADQVADRMGLPRRRVALILSGKSTRYEWDDTDLQLRRAKWRALLAITENSRLAAKERDEGLYRFLWRVDREWMHSQERQRNRSAAGPKADWPVLDQTYSASLRRAVDAISGAMNSARISKMSLLAAAGLNFDSVRHKDRLPLTTEVIRRSVETIEDSYRRRARSVASEMRRNEEKINFARLRKRMGLTIRSTKKLPMTFWESLIEEINVG